MMIALLGLLILAASFVGTAMGSENETLVLGVILLTTSGWRRLPPAVRGYPTVSGRLS